QRRAQSLLVEFGDLQCTSNDLSLADPCRDGLFLNLEHTGLTVCYGRGSPHGSPAPGGSHAKELQESVNLRGTLWQRVPKAFHLLERKGLGPVTPFRGLVQSTIACLCLVVVTLQVHPEVCRTLENSLECE